MSTPSKTLRRVAIILALTVVGFAVLLVLYKNKSDADRQVYRQDNERAIQVKVYRVADEDLELSGSFTGMFDPNQESKISADVQGKVRMLHVDVGDRVGAGTTLVQLDNDLLKLQLQASDVQIEGLEADVKRFTVLAKAEAVQGVQLEKSALALQAARVQRSTVLEQIQRSSVKAPFSGIITAKFTEAGGFAAPGVPLLQITDIGKLRFTINVPESEVSFFRVGDTHRISLMAYPETSVEGRVIMVGSKANPGNSFPVQYLVQNFADLRIKAGMFGSVMIKKPITKTGLMIPATSVVTVNGESSVYVVSNGKARLTPITLGRQSNSRVAVESGLRPGDAIVTDGLLNVFNNANVRIQQ